MTKNKTMLELFRTGTEDELLRMLDKHFESAFENLWCDGKGPCPEDENGDLIFPCPHIGDCKLRCLRETRFKV